MSSLLPAGWGRTYLGEIVFLKTGPFGSALHQADYVLGGVPLVNPMHISGGKIFPSDGMRVSAETLERLCDFRLKKGDVVLGRRGEMGRCAVVTEREVGWLCGTGSLIVRPNSNAMLPEYLQKLLESDSVVRYLLSASVGSTMANLNQEHLLRLEVDVPPVLEQARIIAKFEELLSDIEAGVAELKSAQKKLALYRQSLLKAAVEGALTAEWRQQNAGSPTGDDLLSQISARRRAAWEAAQLEKFEAEGRKPPKDWQNKYAEPVRSDGGGLPAIPSEWAWAKVSQTGLVQLGRQRAPQFHTGPNMLPYLRVANVFENRIDVSDVMQMHFSEADETAYKLAAGDILLNEGQSLELVGRPAIYRNELPNACFTNTLVRYRVEDGVLPEFALAVFLHYMHSGRFRKIATITTNIAHLGAGRFAELEFPLPGTEEQAEIVRRLAEQMESVERQQAAISRALKQAAAQRQNILRAAFSGQLVPQDPADEPAGVLLERIRAERAAGARKPVRGRKGAPAQQALL